MPIQGSAADILKIAMVRLHRALEKRSLGARMILQVHDELVVEVPQEELDTVSHLVRSVMEKAWDLDASLKVDVAVGRNWEQMEAYETRS
jgi:DNA polymerase-1